MKVDTVSNTFQHFVIHSFIFDGQGGGRSGVLNETSVNLRSPRTHTFAHSFRGNLESEMFFLEIIIQ